MNKIVNARKTATFLVWCHKNLPNLKMFGVCVRAEEQKTEREKKLLKSFHQLKKG
jgi:hypothetical protein